MAEETELLREIRDLLRLLAEPALAKCDERLRGALIETIGKSKRKAEAVLLMNGTRSQTEIRKESGIDGGDLSRLLKSLREGGLIGDNDKLPAILFPLPANLVELTG